MCKIEKKKTAVIAAYIYVCLVLQKKNHNNVLCDVIDWKINAKIKGKRHIP